MMSRVMDIIKLLFRSMKMKKEIKTQTPVILVESPHIPRDVLLFIQEILDIPEKRKMEKSLGWDPIGIQSLPKPTIDLLALKKRFIIRNPSHLRTTINIELPIGLHKFYIGIIVSQSRLWKKDGRFWKTKWNYNHEGTRRVRHTGFHQDIEEWWMDDFTQDFLPLIDVPPQFFLMSASTWIEREEDDETIEVIIREDFLIPGPHSIASYRGSLPDHGMKRMRWFASSKNTDH